VERPIFYAIAVIIAGYLPIYVLTGPSGRLFQPMADTMSFALLGALLCALTLLPVLCAYFLRKHVHEPEVRFYVRIRGLYGRMLGWCLRNRLVTVGLVLAVFRLLAAADSVHRRGIHAAPGRRRPVGARHHPVHHLLRGGVQALAADPRHPDGAFRR
jgi:Cu/Ag efflux pump CusA